MGGPAKCSVLLIDWDLPKLEKIRDFNETGTYLQAY